MYKLKNTNGRVTALLRTGKDFVRHSLSVSAAQHIIDTGKQVKSNKPGYPSALMISGSSRVSRSRNPRPRPTATARKAVRKHEQSVLF